MDSKFYMTQVDSRQYKPLGGKAVDTDIEGRRSNLDYTMSELNYKSNQVDEAKKKKLNLALTA